MCGRYVSRADKQALAEAFHASLAPELEDSPYSDGAEPAPDFAPDFNVAPQSWQPVIRIDRETGRRQLTRMRWGLVPYWAKDTKIAYSTINARAETLASSPAFREALKRRRCLIPASAFYEWEKVDVPGKKSKAKQPYAIALPAMPLFAFAGLWEHWRDKATGTQLETYTIITTDPNPLMEKFHERMPVILRPEDYQRWLAFDLGPAPTELLRPFPAKEMNCWKVDPAVGNTRNNSKSLLEPIPDRYPGPLLENLPLFPV